MQVGPERVVCQIRVPEHGIRITKCDLLALREAVGLQVIFQLVQSVGRVLLRLTGDALVASVFAVETASDVVACKLLQLGLNDTRVGFLVKQ